MKILGIDIGGTAVKCAVLEEDGSIIKTQKFDTEASKGIENLWNNMKKFIDENLASEVLGIAVSGTGQIDGTIGKVVGGNPIIPGWIGTNLVEKIKDEYNLPAVLENDVNCAAIGEKWLGAASDTPSFICLTIGTGIGGGIVLDGDLLRGDTFVAGEFGHIQIVKDGEKCLCGKNGCFERYASTTALVRMVENKFGKKLNGLEIFNLEKEGNKEIKEIIDSWIDYMTDGIANLVYIFNPKLVIIGGGVTHQGEHLLNRINESLDNKLGINYKKNLEVRFATLGNNAGILGATYLLLKKLQKI